MPCDRGDGLHVFALCDKGERQVAVLASEPGVQVDGMVKSSTASSYFSIPEMDIAKLIPVLRIGRIDLDGFLIGADGLIVSICLSNTLPIGSRGYEAFVEFDCFFLISHYCIENFA